MCIRDSTLTGRVAQFGRGVMEDVSKKMVREVAECLQANLQAVAPETPSGAASDEAPVPHPPPVTSAPHINAAALLFSVLWDRIKRLFGTQPR